MQDPDDPQSFNRYAYARNNPIKFTDPTGNFWFIPALIGFVVAHAGAISLGLAALSIGASLAGWKSAAKWLGYASMAFGAISIVGGLRSAGMAAAQNSGKAFVEQTAKESVKPIQFTMGDMVVDGMRFTSKDVVNASVNQTIIGGQAAKAGIEAAIVEKAIQNAVAVGSAGLQMHLSESVSEGNASQSPASNSPGGEQSPNPDDLDYKPSHPTQSGGRSGNKIKDQKGPPNSAIPGNLTKEGKKRALVTNKSGEVIRDITPDRAKPVIPGKGFGPKEKPISKNDKEILKRLFGDD